MSGRSGTSAPTTADRLLRYVIPRLANLVHPIHLLVLDPETDYRTNDNIHINENGQKKLGDLLVTLAPSP